MVIVQLSNVEKKLSVDNPIEHCYLVCRLINFNFIHFLVQIKRRLYTFAPK